MREFTPAEAVEIKAGLNDDVSIGQTVDIMFSVILDLIDRMTAEPEREPTAWNEGDWFVDRSIDIKNLCRVRRVKIVGYNIIFDHEGTEWNMSDCRKVEVIF